MWFQKNSAVEYLIVGLGNPGKQYEHTRHNAGFEAVDFCAEKWGISVVRSKFDAAPAQPGRAWAPPARQCPDGQVKK